MSALVLCWDYNQTAMMRVYRLRWWTQLMRRAVRHHRVSAAGAVHSDHTHRTETTCSSSEIYTTEKNVLNNTEGQAEVVVMVILTCSWGVGVPSMCDCFAWCQKQKQLFMQLHFCTMFTIHFIKETLSTSFAA